MATIALPSFVGRYLSKPDHAIRLFPFLADQRIVPLPPTAYDEALDRNHFNTKRHLISRKSHRLFCLAVIASWRHVALPA